MTLDPLNVSALLKDYGLRPHKGLGQNFLVDPGALRNVVACAGLTPEQTVLEVGAGLGSLTRELAAQVRRVVAVEIDAQLIAVLHEVVGKLPNVEIVQGDMLELDPAALVGEGGYAVVANIPYYITSALIRHLLEARVQPRKIVLTVQKEVAERICAGPGKMSLLALSVQVYGEPAVAAEISAGAFYPAPNVDSAVVRVELYPEPRIPAGQLKVFFRLAKAGFSQKRKTLRNSISGGMGMKPEDAGRLLSAAGIDPQRRAETLSLEEWGRVVRAYGEGG